MKKYRFQIVLFSSFFVNLLAGILAARSTEVDLNSTMFVRSFDFSSLAHPDGSTIATILLVFLIVILTAKHKLWASVLYCVLLFVYSLPFVTFGAFSIIGLAARNMDVSDFVVVLVIGSLGLFSMGAAVYLYEKTKKILGIKTN